MPSLRLFILVSAVVFSMASSNPDGGFDPPPADFCSPGAISGATSVELGSRDDDQFDLITDDRVLFTVRGFQGADMLPLRYRVSGNSGDCLSVKVDIYRCLPSGSRCSIEIEESREQLATGTRSLRAYPEGQLLATRVEFVEFNRSVQNGDRILIVAEVAGAISTTHAWIAVEGEEPPDAGATTDAPSSQDAGTGVDASL